MCLSSYFIMFYYVLLGLGLGLFNTLSLCLIPIDERLIVVWCFSTLLLVTAHVVLFVLLFVLLLCTNKQLVPCSLSCSGVLTNSY